MGFGVSVIQRLCKTSVKKNLYWELKDKTIEEAYNGIRMQKRTQKVRVYGIDSNREVRARLIEILYDRVQYHKDKFVAPILHSEMQSMEIKKTGKVEHSQNSHDDQVFSYLMALYVWYDGKNLAEQFHIMKNSIKTDEDVDIEDINIDDTMEANTPVDIESKLYDEDSDISRDLAWIESNAKIITSSDLRSQQTMQLIEARELILAGNKVVRDAYCNEVGLDPSMFTAGGKSNTHIQLPDTLFLDTDFNLDDDESGLTNSILSGNLSEFWNNV